MSIYKNRDNKAKCCGKSVPCEKEAKKAPVVSLDADIKEILEDAKDGRVKKSTRAKINKKLNESTKKDKK